MRLLLPPLLLTLLFACGENRTYVDKLAYQTPSATPLSCVPNLDGRIEGFELKAAVAHCVAGLCVATGRDCKSDDECEVAETLVASPAGVRRTAAPTGGLDLSGTINGQGRRVWDLTADYDTDRIAKVSARLLAGKWFAASFPGGQYVSPIDLGGTLLGIYSEDGSNLFLHGLASAVEAPAEGKTLLPYSTPVAVYKYPLEIAKSWVSVGVVVNGTIRGLPYAGRDTYQVSVDAAGILELTDLTFTQALRVRTRVTIEPAVGASVSHRQVSWMFECFGEVARAVSLDNEPLEDFTTTSEVRRLGL